MKLEPMCADCGLLQMREPSVTLREDQRNRCNDCQRTHSRELRVAAPLDGTGGAMNAEGNRSNVGKLPWHLLPWDAVEEVVRVIDFGAKKYAPRGWEDKPLSWVETCASMTRHTVRFLMGEDRDKETGLHHMAHAACNALFLVAYALRGVKVKDDRGGTGPHTPTP